MSNRNLIDSINADMALETPQTLLKWAYESDLPDIEFVRLRRSQFRYPEDISEGDVLLDEAQSLNNLRTSFADTTVVKDRIYYYSLFLQHKQPFSLVREFERDIERLGVLKSIFPHFAFVEDEVLGTGNGSLSRFSGTLSNASAQPYSVKITSTVGSVAKTITDNGDGTLVGDIGSPTELATNGDFSSWTADDPDSWTVLGESGSDPEVSEVGTSESHGGSGTGSANLFRTTSSIILRQGMTTVASTKYRLTFDISAIAGSVRVHDNPTGDFDQTFNQIGTHSIEFTATTSSITLDFDCRNGKDDVTIDNVSLTEATNVINYDTGDVDVTFDGAVDSGVDIEVDYGHGKTSYWILAYDRKNVPVLWSYNTERELCDERIDLSALAQPGEVFVSITDYTTNNVTRTFEIVSNQRYHSFTITSTAEDVKLLTIVNQWDLVGRLSAGFEVVGATQDIINPATLAIRILDSVNQESKVFTKAGVLDRTTDISGMTVNDDLVGASYDPVNHIFFFGNGENLFGVDSGTVDATLDNRDITEFASIRQKISIDFHRHINDLLTLDNDINILERYSYVDQDTLSQVEQEDNPRTGILGLWHFNEDSGATSLVDESGQGNNASLLGSPKVGKSGKFNNAIELPTISDAIDLDSAASLFDPLEGFIAFWYKQSYPGYTPPVADRVLATIEVDASNRLRIIYTAANAFRMEFIKGGTSNSLNIGGPSFSDNLFHHVLVHWTSSALTLVFDGFTSGGLGSMSGVFVGTPTIFRVGGSSSDSAIGFYDDFVFGQVKKTVFIRSGNLTTKGNRAHALSGRDYTDDIFAFRKELREYFSDFILRNDFDIFALPVNKVLPDGEVIFREAKEDMTLGELGRLSRMFGLMLDRNVDRRRNFMNHLIASEVEDEFIKDLGSLIMATEFDDKWNVDMKRRFLEVTWFTNKRSGTFDAFKRMARFLGFRLFEPQNISDTFIVSRRNFDSVVDPNRPDTPFDTSVFDSGLGGYQVVTMLHTLFIPNFVSSVGATSIPATRELTDAGASFLTDAEVGGMVFIHDASSPGDDGQYLVSSIASDTVLVVNRDFPVGSLTSLDYILHRQVPEPDPFTDEVFTRFNQFKARWQKLDYTVVP